MGTLSAHDVGVAMESLSEEVRELSLGTSGEVERVRGPLSPLQFLRDYVMPGKPCIITDAIDHWPALRCWSNEYLSGVLRDQTVSVHFTPDGRADAVSDPGVLQRLYGCTLASLGAESDGTRSSASQEVRGNSGPANTLVNGGEDCMRNSSPVRSERNDLQDIAETGLGFLFVTAHVEQLPFPEALELITQDTCSKGVAYAQHQNGCFLTEYGLLAKDADEHLPWATEALGCVPEAVNMWIGNEKAVTSFHKDHYENLYAVVAGEKHFTLLPPTDVHRLYVDMYPAAQYLRDKDSGNFSVICHREAPEVPWVSVDPYPPASALSEARAKFSRYFQGPSPFTCTVKAGEILYLPSLWFHHVKQSADAEGKAVAINYWYDMEFDVKYAYFSFINSLWEKTVEAVTKATSCSL